MFIFILRNNGVCVFFLQFFRPLVPFHVHMLFDDLGRPSGQANVDFSSHEEAVKAMAKVREWRAKCAQSEF